MAKKRTSYIPLPKAITGDEFRELQRRKQEEAEEEARQKEQRRLTREENARKRKEEEAMKEVRRKEREEKAKLRQVEEAAKQLKRQEKTKAHEEKKRLLEEKKRLAAEEKKRVVQERARAKKEKSEVRRVIEMDIGESSGDEGAMEIEMERYNAIDPSKCFVCSQKYDDEEADDWVGCTSCDRWFHKLCTETGTDISWAER